MAVRARYLDPKKGARTEATARDLGLGGMFIETETPLDDGALVTVDIEADGQKVTVDARVISVRVKAEGDKPAGMSVRFLDLPPDVAAALMKVLRASQPREKTILGVGGPTARVTAPGPPPAPPRTEKTVLGLGVPPEALEKAPAAAAPPLPVRATAPSNPFDAAWDAPPEPPKDDKSFDKTMDISSSEIVGANEPTPPPVEPGPLLAEASAPEGWKWEEPPQKPKEEPPPAAATAPAPPPKEAKKKKERESPIPEPPKRGGLGWLFWLVVLGGAGGAGYYYRDELMKLVNPPPAPTTPEPAPPPSVAASYVIPTLELDASDGDAATSAPSAPIAEAGTTAEAGAAASSSRDAGVDASSRDAGTKAKDAGKPDAAPKKKAP